MAIAAIHRVTEQAQHGRGYDEWIYCLDFNEGCPELHYLLDFEGGVQEKVPGLFRRVQYIEQPTARDLRAHPNNTMFEAANLAPTSL